MKREDLLRSKEYWTIQIQNCLFQIIENYMLEKKMSRTDLAKDFGVSKGYITQVLNGDFDHKISKMVDLALLSGKVPLVYFVDLNKYIQHDAEKKTYDLYSPIEGSSISFKPEKIASRIKYEDLKRYVDIKSTNSSTDTIPHH